jgi:hypothetical protein
MLKYIYCTAHSVDMLKLVLVYNIVERTTSVKICCFPRSGLKSDPDVWKQILTDVVYIPTPILTYQHYLQYSIYILAYNGDYHHRCKNSLPFSDLSCAACCLKRRAP